RLAGDGQVWNPSPFPRQGVVEIAGKPQRTSMISGSSVGSLLGSDRGVAASARSMHLENALLRCDLSPDGTFTVVDRRTGTRYPALHRRTDDGAAGDEYNCSPTPAAVPTTNS